MKLLIPNATVFISSFCVMVIELTAGRLIARHLGASLYTWTSVIGIVLAGIALGNYIGGRLADKREAKSILSLLFFSSSITSILIVVLNNIIGEWTFLFHLSWPVHVALHVAVVFFLPAMMLGMISPVVAKMALDLGHKVGSTIGNIYAWGVIGSIIGTFVTGYYLIAAFGTITIIWSVAGVLACMGVFYGMQSWKSWVGLSIFIGLLTIGCSEWTWGETSGVKFALRKPVDANILYSKDSQYSHIQIVRTSKKLTVTSSE